MLFDVLPEFLDIFALFLSAGLQVLSAYFYLRAFFLYFLYFLMCLLPVLFGLLLSCLKTLVYCCNGRFDLLVKELLKLQIPYLIIGSMIQLLL